MQRNGHAIEHLLLEVLTMLDHTTRIDRDTATTAIAQFVALAHGRMRGDREAEREANRQLRQLGVNVNWRDADREASK